MLLHSQITTDYLNRRHRLFQFYSQPQPTPTTPHQHQLIPIENVRLWLNSFGQIMLNQKFPIRAVKLLLQQTPSPCISLTRSQIISMIKVSIIYLPASKISNTLYYLCRNSMGFRKSLTQQLQTQYFAICDKQWNKLTQKLSIILTDIFVFGIYFTQQEFITDIFLSTIKVHQHYLPMNTPTMASNQSKYQRVMFQLHYLSHYLEILTLPYILSNRYRHRLLERVYQFLSSLVNTILKYQLKQMERQLTKLQQIYTHPDQSAYFKNQQQAYIRRVYSYEHIRVRILRVIQVLVHGSSYKNNTDICSEYNFEQLQHQINLSYEPVLYCYQQKEEQKQEIANQGGEDIESRESQRSDSFKQGEDEDQRKCEQKRLLTKIYKTCRYFANATIFHKDPLYTLTTTDTLPTYTTATHEGYIFLQQIPQSYIQSLNNCTDIQTSDTLSQLFLQQYNKHCNRVKLVQTVMRELYERNNIGYIVRVLAMVRLVQKEEIDELVEEEIKAIGEKSHGRLNKGLYGRYAQLIIELIKFNITPAQPYLTNLLALLQPTNSALPNEQQNEPSSPATRSNYTEPMPFLQTVISLMQKLGRQLYYHSLPTHITFNQIINYVCHHIRTKTVCYDMDTVNRFNGLVMHLQYVKKEEEGNKKQILLVSELKNERNFNNQVKNMQRIIKKDYNGRDGISRIVDILQNSIEKQNYMDLYLYADLIYQVGSKKLDEAAKKLAMSSITRELDEGNYQGATNWSRFYGQLHRFQIISQKQFINFLQNTILVQYFNKYPAASIKIISTSVEACSYYMKNTNKISQISQTLTFLLVTKKQLLKIKGLKNSILEQEIQDILEYFHKGFKYVRSVEDCTRIQNKINGKNFNVEMLMNDFEDEANAKEANENRVRQKEKERIQKENKQKSIQQQNVFQSKSQRSLYRLKNSSSDKLDQLEKSELETNSSKKTKSKESVASAVAQQPKPKKIKIIARSKVDKNKIDTIMIKI